MVLCFGLGKEEKNQGMRNKKVQNNRQEGTGGEEGYRGSI